MGQRIYFTGGDDGSEVTPPPPFLSIRGGLQHAHDACHCRHATMHHTHHTHHTDHIHHTDHADHH